jgi:hypothetical protein
MVWWKTCGHWGSKDGGWSPGTASLGWGLHRELRLTVPWWWWRLILT